MRRLALTALAALALTLGPGSRPCLAGQDAPPPAPPPAPAPGPAREETPALEEAKPRAALPAEPNDKIKKDVQKDLVAWFASEASLATTAEGETSARAGRDAALGALDKVLQSWNAAIAPNNGLRLTAWWKARAMETLPAENVSSGSIKRDEFLFHREKVPMWVSIPKKYRGGGTDTYPLIITVLDKDADGKKVLPAVYGPLLESHIVVASMEDRVKDAPGKMILGLLCAYFRYRVDRDRVVIDGVGKGARCVDLVAASDLSLQFNGAVFRSATAKLPLPGNLGLFPCAIVAAEPAPEAVATFIEAARKANPKETVVLPPGDEGRVQAWIAALPPRRCSDQAQGYSYWMRTGGSQAWGYWFNVTRAVESGEGQSTMNLAVLKRDPKYNLIDLAGKNIAEGFLYLNDELLDLDQPVTVRMNGIVVARKKATPRSLSNTFALDSPLSQLQGPRNYFITATLSFSIPAGDARQTVEEREAEAALARRQEEQRKKEEEDARRAAEAPKPGGGAATPEWPPEIAAALGPAKEAGKPLLAILGAVAEAPAQKALDGALADGSVAPKAAGFVPVRLSLDGDAGKAAREAVEKAIPGLVAPALAALRPDGTPLGSLATGALDAAAVTPAVGKWLDDMLAAAAKPAESPGPAEGQPATVPAPTEPTWLADWAAALEVAKKDGKSLVVVFDGAKEAPGQALLETLLARPESRERLARCACVRLSTEGDAGEPHRKRLATIIPGAAAPLLAAVKADESVLATLGAADLKDEAAALPVLARLLDAAAPAPATPKAPEAPPADGARKEAPGTDGAGGETPPPPK